MSSEQVKGTLLAVGATAASTALLVGGIVGYNQIQVTSAADKQAIIFNETHSVSGATDALTGTTGAFSDHCTVMREGIQFTVGPMSFTTSNTSLRGTPVPPTRSATGFDWQWANKTRITPIGVRPEAPGIVGTTPQNVSTPEGRTQENLNAWYQQIWDSGFKVGRVEIGYAGSTTPAVPQVLAAHCEWDMTVSSHADTNLDGATLSDNVTVGAAGQERDESPSWLVVNGEKAQVTAHGRVYHTAEKPSKGSGIPADATLIGETDLDFTAPGTQTATVAKPASLDGGYVTWVWTIEKNNQPSEWGKYLLQDATDGWAADNEVVEVPKAPSSSPSVTPSTPVSETPGTQSPAPSGNETPAPTPTSEPPAPQKPSVSLAHTGTTFFPLIGMSVFLLAGGVATALRKRHTI